MSHKKLGRSIILLLGVLLCIAACVGSKTLISRLREGATQLPVRSFRITVDKIQRDELFNQLRKFADKHGFQFELSDYGTGGEHFQVWMLRDNVKIIAEDIPPTGTQVSLGFYARSPDDPPPDEELIDALSADLKNLVNEIPDVTITEEK